MLMNENEYSAFKELLLECRNLTKEFDVSLNDILQLRILLSLKWAEKTYIQANSD